VKILIISTTSPSFDTHWGTELEIMQRHIDDGDVVTHLCCNGELLACECNLYHDRTRCKNCIGRRRHGLSLLSKKVQSRSLLNLTHRDRVELADLPMQHYNLKEFSNKVVENFDIGFAVASSMISMIRDHEPVLSEHGSSFQRFVISALSVYRSVLNYLREHPVDRVYVFNGRLATCRAVFRACQSMKVPCFVHERGHDIHHYVVDENHTQLELAYIEHCIRQSWRDASNQSDRDAIAEKFYTDRLKGRQQSWYSFIGGQEDGLLPRNWVSNRRNIVIFNSSEDEYASIGNEWRNPLYADQQEGLERILDTLSNITHNVHLYLRIHPNLKTLDNTQTRKLATLSANFLTVIPPDDPVSTYTLVKNATAVLTFGSTVGIEGVYWGTPSILAGQSYYRNLGGTYNPSSHDELITMIKSELPPKNKEGAKMYGYFLNTFGMPFKYYKATSITNGTFKEHAFEVEESLADHVKSGLDVMYILRSRLRVLHSLRLPGN